MKVVITGATGFIGQNLMPQLRALGPDFEYLLLNHHVEKAERMYPTEVYRNFRHANASDMKEVISFNPDVVIHLAALVSSSNETDIISPMLAANIEFGVLLLDALRHCDNFKLFVNTGSFAEYRLGSESINNAYLYSATKTAFRSFLEYYSGLGKGFKYITAIPYSVYGGTMTIKRLFDYLAESMYADKPIDMTAGEQKLDFIHVDDVAAFYSYVVSHVTEFIGLHENGLDFHLGTGKGTTIREVADMIEGVAGRRCNVNWGGRPYREHDVMYAVAPVDINHGKWVAKISLQEGIKKFLNNVVD